MRTGLQQSRSTTARRPTTQPVLWRLLLPRRLRSWVGPTVGAGVGKDVTLTRGPAEGVVLSPAPSFSSAQSRQQLLDHFAVHVGQPEVAALEPERQLRVIEAEQVQDRRVQVVDVDLVLDRR